MPRNTTPRFCKTLIALAVGAALAQHGAWALDLSQSPPGTVEPYVRPNVIISIDDSGSMDFRLDQENASGAINDKKPDANGNWPAKSRRMNVLKYALVGIDGTGGIMRDMDLLPDKKIRLAWQSMNANNSTPGTLNSGNSVQSNTNSMKIMESTHRANFISFINKLTSSSSTPSHKMFKQADEYMRLKLDKNGPWAADPGSTAAPYLGCRRNYHIFMTDGRWNGSVSGGSKDSNEENTTLPDGMVYGSKTAAKIPYNKLYHDTFSNTLADWSFYSWSTPLQTAVDTTGVAGLKGTVQPAVDYRKAPDTENFGKGNVASPTKDAILERYWNPRYNPATWPHMVTYTIGFSNAAITWPDASAIKAPTEKVPFGYDGSFQNLVTGKQAWPNMGTGEGVRALDLWHAALNGRGRFYAVDKGEDLEKAFREIFGKINAQTDPDLTSTATSGSNNSRNDVGKYIGAYEPKNAWKGFVSAETVKKDGTTEPAASWAGKNTADKLDARSLSDRVILSWSDEWDSSEYKGGVSFEWSNLSTTQKASLGLDATTPKSTSGELRLDFIRGKRGDEGSEADGYPANKPFRERKSRQGDIINSVVWYTGAPSSTYPRKGYTAFIRDNKTRPAMLYVGGNDGMLHGFSAADGEEKIAYVPRGVIASLPLLTDPTYNNKHRYFVDGSPMTGDVDMSKQDYAAADYVADWRTLLVGTLGAGGRGYFVLDVTNPKDGFTTSNAKNLVKLDRTRGTGENVLCTLTSMSSAEKEACATAVEEDKDIGYITARPVVDEVDPMRTTQITRLNNNRWAVVMGNGYNSFNQRPVLLVQYLDGDQELLRIPVTSPTETPGTGNAKDNGLSAPRLYDLDGDGLADIAYAGDNLGNMWKFDLTNPSDASWNVAFGGAPLFTAQGPSALGSASRPNAQPITIAPTLRANDRMMTVGTEADATTVAVGGMMVAFGTGRNVDLKDPESVEVQTLYSVLDNTRYRKNTTTKRLEVHPGGGTCSPKPLPDCVPVPKALGAGVTNAKLAEQKLTAVGTDNFRIDVKDTENELKADTWAKFNGWFLDLPSVSERALKPFEFYDGSNVLIAYTQVPAKGSDVDPNIESCESTSVDEERQRRTLINIMDGKRPDVQIVDANGDTLFNADDGGVSSTMVSKGAHNIIGQKDKNVDIDAKNNSEALALMPEQSLRPSWRQVK